MALSLMGNTLVCDKIVTFLEVQETIFLMRCGHDLFNAIKSVNRTSCRKLSFNWKDCHNKVNILKLYNLHCCEVYINTNFPRERYLLPLDQQTDEVCHEQRKMPSELLSLIELSNLKRLEFEFGEITQDTLKAVSTLVHLPRLSFKRTITDEGLVHLTSLQNLRTLELSECKITNNGLVQVAKLTNLTILLVDSTDITDEGLVHLSCMQNLRTLDLSECQITDNGLQHVCGLPNLNTLHLRDCMQINGTGLSHFNHDCKLSALVLYPNLNDNGLLQICKLKNLNYLHIRGNDQITIDGVDHIITDLRKLQYLDVSKCVRINIKNFTNAYLNPLLKIRWGNTCIAYINTMEYLPYTEFVDERDSLGDEYKMDRLAELYLRDD